MSNTIKYTKEVVEEAAKNSESYAGMMRFLGKAQSGGLSGHLKRLVIRYDIDISHFTHQGHTKGKPSTNRKSKDEILIYDDTMEYRAKTNQLVRALLESGVEYECSECCVGETYNGKPISLQVDHINGIWYDNRKENLRFLCPNCHSQTSTFCRRK